MRIRTARIFNELNNDYYQVLYRSFRWKGNSVKFTIFTKVKIIFRKP